MYVFCSKVFHDSPLKLQLIMERWDVTCKTCEMYLIDNNMSFNVCTVSKLFNYDDKTD